ncbi:hypothetical protein A374_07474 [Fictibacillus macauensis ZFHKF-1]|uniref:Major facilitator superfamily (MFS) profile domain-containing protein n=1 Tax=Fictibacillus macauensis ZFHKF-1 TaxID=1196324 RepID=I8UFR3_9BACL|nr:MFS transporter [Fictibacillus macauensis]EIT85658.1 hypothetical protein A374_07474 [Fictibacillus macauensis ZFHKF-1]
MSSVSLPSLSKKVLPSRPLFKNRAFIFLLTAGLFANLAFSLYIISETWYVLNTLQQPKRLGTILVFATLPRLLLMTFAGVLGDRYSRQRILTVTLFARSLLLLGILPVFYYNYLNFSVLCIFTVLFGALDAFYWPISQTLMTELVSKEQLVRANSLSMMIYNITSLTGPILAGIILTFFSYGIIFLTTSIMLIFSALIIYCSVQTKSASHEPRKERQDSSFLMDFKQGLTYVKSIPFLLIMMFASIIINLLIVGPLSIGIPFIAKQTLHGDVLSLSYMETAFAVGLLGGATLISITQLRRKRPLVQMSSIGCLALCVLLLSQVHMLWQCLILLSVAGIFLGIVNSLGPALVQEQTDPIMMSRVQSILATGSMGFVPLSFALMSVLLSSFSIHTILLYSGAALFIFILCICISSQSIRTMN